MNISVDVHVRSARNSHNLGETVVEVGPLYPTDERPNDRTWTVKIGRERVCLYFDDAQHVADFANQLLGAVRVATEPDPRCTEEGVRGTRCVFPVDHPQDCEFE